MGKTAILLGSTGLTGSLLLQKLLKDEDFSTVIIFARRSCGIKHPKVREHIIDLLQLSQYKQEFKADVVFCCIGTTKTKTPDKDIYRQIDYGIPVNAAKLCEQNKIDCLIVISALGAKANSKIFYNRIKGEMEEEVLRKDVPRIHILKPSLIKGKREQIRVMERIGEIIMYLLKPFLIGELTKFRAISAEDIVKCMIWLSLNQYQKEKIQSDEIVELSKKL